jgi:hypothetical protein
VADRTYEADHAVFKRGSLRGQALHLAICIWEKRDNPFLRGQCMNDIGKHIFDRYIGIDYSGLSSVVPWTSIPNYFLKKASYFRMMDELSGWGRKHIPEVINET